MAEEEKQYVVKGVLSGDTLSLVAPNLMPPVEKLVGLAGIEVPKLARKMPTVTQDEPYAWEAREFVRQKLIGKLVKYTCLHKVENIDKEFGKVCRIFVRCLFLIALVIAMPEF